MKTSSLCSILFLLAAACSGSPKTSTVQNGEGSGSGTSDGSGSDDDEVVADGPGIGEDCGEDDTCAPGLECVHYYGFAGPSGPEFKTCEIRCDGKASCPEGLSCATIADGPGAVCRP